MSIVTWRNGPLEARCDLDHGGALFWLSYEDGPNLINQLRKPWGYDWGREVQTALFLGNHEPGDPNDVYPNPTQAGGDFGKIANPVVEWDWEETGESLYVKARMLEYSPQCPTWIEQKKAYYRDHAYPYTGWNAVVEYALEGDELGVEWRLWADRPDRIQLATCVATLQRRAGMRLLNESMRDASSHLARTIADDRLEVLIPDLDLIVTVTAGPAYKLVQPPGSPTHDYFGTAAESREPMVTNVVEGWMRLSFARPDRGRRVPVRVA